MNDFLKKNLGAIIIVTATLVLAGIAVFTAIRLYNLRQQSVAPNAPSSRPAAATVAPTATPIACQALAFTITTPTGSGSPTATPTVTPTATPVAQCGTTCSSNSDCPSSMICYVGLCRNPDCTQESSCVCATATPTPTATATTIALVSPTATPTLPNSGNTGPTYLGLGAGAVLLIAGLALVL